MQSRHAVPVGYVPDQLERDWHQAKMQREHRMRVSDVKPHTDTRTPTNFGMPHMSMRLKQKMMAEERKQQIFRDNQILLLKMNHILTHKTVDNDTSHARSCGKRMQKNMKTAKNFKLKMIQRENESLSRRLENTKSEYAVDKLRKERKSNAHRIVPSRAGTLWSVGKDARGSATGRSSSLRTAGGSMTRSSLSKSGPTLRERTRAAAEAGYRRRRGTRASSTSGGGGGGGLVMPLVAAAGVSGDPSDFPPSAELDPDEALFYDTCDTFLSKEALEARKTSLHLMADTKRFVGRDLVLGRQQRRLVDVAAVAAVEAEREVLEAKGEDPASVPDPPTELWDLDVVEVGHLSREQDDMMTGIRVDGTRVSDGATFTMPLDIDMLKAVSQRYDKAAYITLSQAKRGRDPAVAVPVYGRLSRVPPSTAGVKLGEDPEGHDVGEKHQFYLGRLVKFILDRCVLTDEESRLVGSLLSFHQRR